MASILATPRALTVEEFAVLPDHLDRIELVCGEVVSYPIPGFEYGIVCGNVLGLLSEFARSRKLGRVVGITGVVTHRQPDSVRGPDVCYYSFERLPAGQSPKGYPDVTPDLTVDVKSPTDRWRDILEKVSELLSSGVTIVCLIDPERRQAHLYRDDAPVQIVNADGVLEFPEMLSGFAVPLATILETST